MILFKKKRRPKKKAEEKPIKFDVNKLLENLKKRFEHSGANAKDDLFRLFKRFFRHSLHLKHNFTYEELNNQIMRNKEMDMQLKNDITTLSKKLSNIEYGGVTPSNNEMNFFITDFELITARILEIQNKKRKRLVTETIFTPIMKLKEIIISFYAKRKSMYLNIMKQTKDEIEARNLQQLEELIARTQETLRNGDEMKARQGYSEIRTVFDRLSTDNRRANYRKIVDLYDKIVKL